MARFRKIDPRIWADEKFRHLIPQDKLIALHCLTSSQANRIGIFYLSPALAAEQLGMKAEGYAKGIQRVCDTLGWGIDEAVNVLYMPTWWRYNGGIGHLTLRGYLEDLHEVPQTPLLQEFMANRTHLSDRESAELDTFAMGMPRVCQGYLPKSAQETETETETELETELETETSSCPAGSQRNRSERTAAVELVLNHYREHHTRANPGEPDRKRILARLAEGFSADDLIEAIDGNHRDPYCCGENPGGKKYHTLELIFRDSAHTQKYIEVPAAGAARFNEKERRGIEAGQRFIEKGNTQ